MPFAYVVFVAAKQHPERVSSIAFPVAWRVYALDRGWEFSISLHAFQCQEGTPCFIVFANDLLCRSGSNEWDILLVNLWVPVQFQVVTVLLTMQVVDLVPELRAVDCELV
jgi:hypothetical protein